MVEFADSKINSEEVKKLEYQREFQLNESNLEHYLGELDFFMQKLLLFKLKITDPENIFNKAILIDELNVKDHNMKTKQFSSFCNYSDQHILEKNDDVEDKKLLKYENIRNLALESLEKRKIIKGQKQANPI